MYRSFLRPVFIIFGLIALAAYATIMFRGPQGLAALQEKQNEAHRLEVENANMRKQNTELQQRINRLMSTIPTRRKPPCGDARARPGPGDTSFVIPEQPKKPQ